MQTETKEDAERRRVYLEILGQADLHHLWMAADLVLQAQRGEGPLVEIANARYSCWRDGTTELGTLAVETWHYIIAARRRNSAISIDRLIKQTRRQTWYMGSDARSEFTQLCIAGCGNPKTGKSEYCAKVGRRNCQKAFWEWIDDQVKSSSEQSRDNVRARAKRLRQKLKDMRQPV